jgi:predicted unusual protein kinase regulating ubiquinone biosynthesis (AarF/ABC1/UbiB family)
MIAKTLGELKGAVMKVGQMASVASDLLPPELTEALRTLQREAPPMPYEIIEEQIERELGAPVLALFDEFDPEPFAAASIGQVHRALTDDGQDVVVKVQYPGVDESCDSDLRHLRLALKASGFVRSNPRAFNALFAEMRIRLREELDYCIEADHVRLFGEMHRDDDFVVVPQVVGTRSAKRVLTMTYESGDHMDDLQKPPYTQEIRDRIGTNLYRLYGRQLFCYRTFHADPNPGNFAFREDGTIVLYDYGCIKRLEPTYVQVYRDVCRAALEGRVDEIDPLLFALGARVPGTSAVPHSFYQTWVDVLLSQVTEEEIFDYRTSRHHLEIMKLVPLAMEYLDFFQPPPEGVLVDRVVLGLHNNFRAIGPRLRWVELLKEHVELADSLGPLDIFSVGAGSE